MNKSKAVLWEDPDVFRSQKDVDEFEKLYEKEIKKLNGGKKLDKLMPRKQ